MQTKEETTQEKCVLKRKVFINISHLTKKQQEVIKLIIKSFKN